MFIKMTEHYRGRFPVDIGGLVFSSHNPREVEDKFGDLLVRSNYPNAAPCTKDGRLLMKVPPLSEAPKPVVPEVPKPAPEKEPEQPKSEAVAPEVVPEGASAAAPEEKSPEAPADSLDVEVIVPKRGRK